MSETNFDKFIQYSEFVALLLIETFVFITLKGKIDPSGIVTLLSYLAASFLRILPSFILVQYSTQYIVWFVIYFFTFEILKIEATFKGTNPREVAKDIKAIDLRKLVFLILLLGVVVPTLTGVLALQLNLPKNYLKNQKLYDIIFIVARVIKLFLDSYIFYSLFRLMNLFIRIRKALNKHHN
jgi:hypothetical protein